ncbi:MAG TPA: hypothetical protein VM537_21415, partial [Anaerolineae bacterium]|nr:hypothetical protein [Anaerolineae bacterium]
MTVTYVSAQAGNEIVGVWTTGAITVSPVPVLGGAQFTIPAPNELLFRSLTLTLTPTVVAGNGIFGIALCNDVDEAVFSATNLPSNQTTIPIYSAAHTFVALTPVTFALELGTPALQTGGFVGNTQSAMQVLNHSDFQGNIALIFSDTAATVQFGTSATLVGDETPFLTGLPTGKQRQSRADFCFPCSSPFHLPQGMP